MIRPLKACKWFLIVAASSCLLWLSVSCAMYRLPSGEIEEDFTGEIHYKFLELGLTNREVFEELFGNRIVRLEGQSILFVPATQKARLWRESPHDMWEKKYTFRAKLKAKRLLFGGYGVAEVVGIERLEKEPILSK
jgi:hypothetical protein